MSEKPYEDVKCPDCDGPMVSRKGKYGVFWGCKKFPDCKGTRDSQGRSKRDRAEERGEEYNDNDKETMDNHMEGARKFSFRKT